MIPGVFLKILWLALAVILFILAFEGNVGKGLACIIAPGALTANDNSAGQNNQNANQSVNQSQGASSVT
jgi:hypothetical protein